MNNRPVCTFFVSLYFIGVLLNWGFVYQRPERWIAGRNPDDFERGVIPFGMAMVWPIYWLGQGALWITEPQHKTP